LLETNNDKNINKNNAFVLIDKGYTRGDSELKIENSYLDDENDGLIWYKNILRPSFN
jgi:hypothetical protein